MSRCMRTHGVPNFPDPQFENGPAVARLRIGGAGIDPSSPAFQAAPKACGSIFGGAPTLAKAPGLAGETLPARVQLLDRCLGLLVAGGRGRAALRRRPRRRVGELVLERLQRRLGGLDLALEPLLLLALFGGAALPIWCAAWPLSAACRASRAAAPRALLADPHVLGPAADVAAQRPSSIATSASRRRRAARGRGRRAAASRWNSASACSSASRLSRSRWLVGSSRISTLAPDWTRIASDSRRRSPPDSPRAASRPPRRRTGSGRAARAPCRRQPGRALRGLEHGARGAGGQLLGVLGQEAELDVVPGAELAGTASSPPRRPASRSASSCRRRSGRPATRARRARATARRRRAACLSPAAIRRVRPARTRPGRCAPAA